MPIFETVCGTCDHIAEHYYRSQTAEPQCCDLCSGTTKFLISGFNAPWTGTLDRFNDPTKKTHMAVPGGHMAFRVKSSRLANGAPEPVKITTVQEQREFCRAESLEDPAYDNPHNKANADGTWNKSRPRGAWL